MAVDLIIGAGEVGKGLGEVLENAGHTVMYLDPGSTLDETEYDCVHFCFPYSDTFVEDCAQYIEVYEGSLYIIHSTVEVGTTRELPDVAYSFVRGRHPNMAQTMIKQTKHVGAVDIKIGMRAAEYLKSVGFTVHLHDNPEVVELGKLWDTTYYGICIAATKLIGEMCDHYGVDYSDLTEMNKTYNEGALATGNPQWVRPTLNYVKGPIGGHCVVPNAQILQNTFTSKLLEEIVDAQ